MIREAVAGDEPALEAYLATNFATTMFMRGNLRDFGLGNSVDMYAMRYFMTLKNGAITGVCGVANFGTVMGEADGNMAALASFSRDALPPDFACKGILGAPAACKSIRTAFGLEQVKASFDHVEPLFTLNLNDLILPEMTGFSIRRTTQNDMPLLTRWAYDYVVETGLREAGEHAMVEAVEDAKGRVDSEKFRFLMQNGAVVAQTGFNSVIPDCVQIGGVYTPPDQRRKGFGRIAVAMHLAEARENDVEKAILFSANKYASRAYMAIGFEQIGSYVLTLFNDAKD